MALHGDQTLFDGSGDNTAQAAKAVAGQLILLEVSNINIVDGYIQLFDAAAADVTVGTTTPKQSYIVPKGDGTNRGGMTATFAPNGMDFQTAITYSCTTTATGGTALTTALVVNIVFR